VELVDKRHHETVLKSQIIRPIFFDVQYVALLKLRFVIEVFKVSPSIILTTLVFFQYFHKC